MSQTVVSFKLNCLLKLTNKDPQELFLCTEPWFNMLACSYLLLVME